MRLQVSIAALAFLCAGLGAQAPPASAPASAASGKIGIVNVHTAIQNCQEGKKAVADLNSQFGPKQSDLQNQSKQIQQLQKQLQDGGNTLSADAKAELTRTITSKQKDLQRAYDDAQSEYQNAQNDVINRIGTKLMKVINSYAQAHGYTLILDVSSPQTPVLFATKALDLTPEIVRLYDQQYPATAAAAKPAAGAPQP